ncbi:MAG: hypothetical protein HYV07_11645 [Deltaproteobacteria bacterium]|nr:hypothetical protein [Deltaproteobacteria bacterium]
MAQLPKLASVPERILWAVAFGALAGVVTTPLQRSPRAAASIELGLRGGGEPIERPSVAAYRLESHLRRHPEVIDATVSVRRRVERSRVLDVEVRAATASSARAALDEAAAGLIAFHGDLRKVELGMVHRYQDQMRAIAESRSSTSAVGRSAKEDLAAMDRALAEVDDEETRLVELTFGDGPAAWSVPLASAGAGALLVLVLAVLGLGPLRQAQGRPGFPVPAALALAAILCGAGAVAGASIDPVRGRAVVRVASVDSSEAPYPSPYYLRAIEWALGGESVTTSVHVLVDSEGRNEGFLEVRARGTDETAVLRALSRAVDVSVEMPRSTHDELLLAIRTEQRAVDAEAERISPDSVNGAEELLRLARRQARAHRKASPARTRPAESTVGPYVEHRSRVVSALELGFAGALSGLMIVAAAFLTRRALSRAS